MNEVIDVSFENYGENSLHGSFEDKFDRVLEELHFGQYDYGKQMIEKYEGCRVFYDPMTEYVENIYSGNGGLCVCSKYQIPHHNLFPLSPSCLIKHDEEA